MFTLHNVRKEPAARSVGPKNANFQYFNGDNEKKLDTLVRETIQNPLDHPANESTPIKVVFEKKSIDIKQIPYVNDLEEIFNALIQKLERMKRTDDGQMQEYVDYFMQARTMLVNNEISILQISDYNTTGLLGKSRFDEDSIIGRFLGGLGWFDDSSGGGGSGGLGKLAPFQHSLLNLCFYSSFNTNNEHIYYGCGDYFTHVINGEEKIGQLVFGDERADVLKLGDDLPEFLNNRTQYGTDVYVLGFKPIQNWAIEIVKASIRNFYGSIIEGKLIVEVVADGNLTYTVTHETIQDNLNSFFAPRDSNRAHLSNGLQSDRLTYELVMAYLENTFIYEDDLNLIGKCRLIIRKYDPTIDIREHLRHVSFMRKPRMHIYSKKYESDISFTGVFMTLSEIGNKVLRKSEDSKHDNWVLDKNLRVDRATVNGSLIKREIEKFIKDNIKRDCSNNVVDEFEISASRLISFGKNSDGKNQVSSQPSETETVSIIPIQVDNNQIKQIKSGAVLIQDKEGVLKEKQPNKDQKDPKPTPPSNNSKILTYSNASELNAIIFKSDGSNYILYISPQASLEIESIKFEINGAEDIEFVESVQYHDQESKEVDKIRTNIFGPISLNAGDNSFKVTTSFEKSLEIKLSISKS